MREPSSGRLEEDLRLGVLIPAYQPNRRLTALAGRLVEAGVPVIVVDDGSPAESQSVFQELDPAVVVLRHGENRGKGRALKTGLAYMAEQGFRGAVTADADGQHSTEDIIRVARTLAKGSGRLILGAREISKMPPRSRTGNRLTQALFRALYGIRLQDTQTGLRGIPLTEQSLSGLLALSGERYEYEMEMLIQSAALFPAGVEEVPIQTIYLPDSADASHFRPLRDGAKIYSVLFRRLPGFFLSSLVAFLVDYLAFNLLYYLVLGRSVPAALLARGAAAGVNYNINRRLVFGGSFDLRGYLRVLLSLLLVNCALLYLLVDRAGLPAFLMKPLVDGGLYAVSFVLQNRLAQGHAGRGERHQSDGRQSDMRSCPK